MKLKFSFLLLVLVALPFSAFAQLSVGSNGFPSAKHRPDGVVLPKVVHGVVQDAKGSAIPDAKVFIRDMKTNVVRTVSTDKDGAYTLSGLPPDADYEVYAQYQGKDSDKKLVSSFVTREDNLLTFKIDLIFSAPPDDSGPTVMTFDLVKLRASLDVPPGVPAPVPSALLLHGYGEDRTVWEPLKKRLLSSGFAVMTLDLRGHGQSTSQNQQLIHASPEWRTDPRQFPLDLESAVKWLKSQERLDGRKIVIVGSDIGADLAFVGSGRLSSVGAIVAINPKLNEALAMAGSAQDFTPNTALILTSDATAAQEFKPYMRGALSIRSFPISGGTANWLENKDVMDAILSWIRQTY